MFLKRSYMIFFFIIVRDWNHVKLVLIDIQATVSYFYDAYVFFLLKKYHYVADTKLCK